MYNIINHLVVVVKVIIVNNSSFVKITLHGCMDANYFNVSIAICIPNLNAYSKMAASARLAYLLQQSWYFSKIFFCSSVMDLSRSSLCLLIYSSSCCISGVLCLPSSGGSPTFIPPINWKLSKIVKPYRLLFFLLLLKQYL